MGSRVGVAVETSGHHVSGAKRPSHTTQSGSRVGRTALQGEVASRPHAPNAGIRVSRGRRPWDTGIVAASPSLFDLDLPVGFHYREDFITDADERVLLEAIGDVAFSDFQMRGVVARRRVAFFGQSYDRATAGPLPAFLFPLRAKIAQWAGVDSEAFAMALINEYRPGTPIGWHRDAPQYDIVAGISLLSACRMKFRRYRSPATPKSGRRSATHEIGLDRRSAYLMTQESRHAYEHHIPPVAQLRYSVTFRTLR